ncbi:sulfite exporter TauE/SafE family protein [Citricoccus sp. GCM10030269]|uniref:sulfite exporter TauE/SafE family protein n=1 Tax=Citricoccus sp. GCM10030269 TaxID=3273388 RepID=UPI00360CC263
MLTGLEDITTATVVMVVLAGLAAGWIDAVVGGGGLLQLPVILMVPGITPVQALATNKMGSIFGTTTSAVTYARRVHPDLKTALPMAVVALGGSFGGAVVATLLPAEVIKPVIVLALIGVAIFTAAKPQLGRDAGLRYEGRQHVAVAMLIGLVIGFYDGLLGPGTGTFLVISLVAILGYNFLQGSAKAKIVNLATNLGAIAFFWPSGHILLGLGLLLGVANMIGGYVGARMAVRRGSGFIRIVFLVVVFVLIAKLGYDLIIEWS